jgi:hypothetical protein
MNQIDRTFHLRQFMNSPDGWGRADGSFVGRKLAKYIADADPSLVRIALDGVRKMDVTFASAALIELIAENLRSRSMCLIRLTDAEVIENVAASAERMKVPVTLWQGDTAQILGPQPSSGIREALAYALARPQVRTAEFAKDAEISAANSSSKFRQLWERGFLMRREGTAASGGPEYVYRRIG